MGDQAVMNNDSDKKLECTINVEDTGAWKKKITIEIPRKEIDSALGTQYKELRRHAEVPGFRKGRAPQQLVEKRFGVEVKDQTKLQLLGQAFEIVDEKHSFEILGEPDFDPAAIELPATGDMHFEYEVEVRPEFELPELENIKVEKPLIEVDKAKVDDAVLELCNRSGTTDTVDGAAKENDTVEADVTVIVKGVDEHEVLSGIALRVSKDGGAIAGVALEDLGKTLNGVKAGDTKKTKGTAPETHANEAYQNNEIKFEISVTSVKRMHPAELNETFFAQLGVPGEEELRKYLEQDLEAKADKEVRQVMARQIEEYLDGKIDFELPVGVAARHGARVLQSRYYELLNMGIPQESISENIEKLRASTGEQAIKELKRNIIMEDVVRKLEITVSDPEVNGWIYQIASQYDRRPEKVRDELQANGRLDELKSQIGMEKAIDKILEMAEVVDGPGDGGAKTAVKKGKTTKKTAKKIAQKAEDNKDGTDKKAPAKKTKKTVKRKAPESDK